MNKDAYYFPHFCNARHDRKIKRIIKELGVEGYGIFFMLLEVLRDQTDFKYPLEDIDLLADEFGTSEPKVRTVICNYKLFNVDKDEKFFSPKLLVYLQPYLERSVRARQAALKRWDNTNAMQMHSDSNASKVKESKVKESKEDEEDVLFTIDKLKDRYLSDEDLVSAVIQTLNTNHGEIEKKLTAFNEHLKSTGINSKKWLDYTSHFLNWSRINKNPKKVSSPFDNLAF